MSTEPEPEVIEPLSNTEAKRLDKKIRAASNKVATDFNHLIDLLEQAERGLIHVALDCSSWTAYVKDAVQIQVSDRLERKALVQLMSGKGMSQRAIAGSLNVDQKTVSNDLREQAEENSSPKPDNIVGLDGKKYKRKAEPEPEPSLDAEVVEPEPETKPVPESEPKPEPQQPPITHDFRDDVEQLIANVQALLDDTEDDRFPSARNRIKNAYLDQLLDAINDLQRVTEVLMGNADVDGADAT
jgi:hypothetical protein